MRKVYCLDQLQDVCDLKDGIFAVYKPKAMSSFDVIRKLKKACGYKKIGHGGTLDPLAEGILVIGVGDGTKELWNLPQNKEYVTEFL